MSDLKKKLKQRKAEWKKKLKETIPGSKVTRGQILKMTNVIYDKACKNMDISAAYAMIEPYKSLVGAEYIRLIKKLPMDDLDLILMGHEHKLVLREENTIQEILQEITDRTLLYKD